MTQATSAACHIQPCGFRQCNSAGKVVHDSTLPAATQELVKIRASQINGCAVRLDMHTKDAAHAGETSVRLNLIAGDYQPGQWG